MGLPFAIILSAFYYGAEAYKSEKVQPHKAYDQTFADRYSPLKYLGGLGPYNTRSGDGISTDIPEGCTIDQVVILGRHGERYPDPPDVKSQLAVLDKIGKKHPQPFVGDLAFLNGWTYFLEGEELGSAGLLIPDSPYSGTADLYAFGAQARSKYDHLWDQQSIVPIFAAETERVVQSAREFGQGFFGLNYSDIAILNVLANSPSLGADTLSPRYCKNQTRTSCDLPDKSGLNGVYDIVFPELEVAAVRLNKEYNLDLTGNDVGQLFEIAAYDVSARGWSPWVDVFTANEWITYNYRKSLWFDCYFGPDSPSAKAIGTSFLNATATLLNQGPENGLPLALNFAHDTDITSVLAAAGILLPSKKLSTKNLVFGHGYDLNDITPMGARLVIERLNCKAPYLNNGTDIVSSNASAPGWYLNQSYGVWNGTTNNITGYFPNATAINATANCTTPKNSTSPVTPANTTSPSNSSVPHSGYGNSTTSNSTSTNSTATNSTRTNSTTLGNGTLPGNSTLTNSTNIKTPIHGGYHYVYTEKVAHVNRRASNSTESDCSQPPPMNLSQEGPVQESIFVRVLLNDAVVPLDFGYEGPGYSISLSKFTEHVNEVLAEHSYESYCKPDNNTPSYASYWWHYNTTSTYDYQNGTLPWQAASAL